MCAPVPSLSILYVPQHGQGLHTVHSSESDRDPQHYCIVSHQRAKALEGAGMFMNMRIYEPVRTEC